MNSKTFRNPGDTYKNFIIKRSVPIHELQVHLLEIEHSPSKAQIIHILADDEENSFCLSFQTLPDSSNGVAHILEHTVLCGSDKYPVRDPFFSMTRRSLNTFMNAMTGNDFTCYPAASQVEKDFYNLLDIYIDAVFHPKLHPLSFKQEGHRLEFSNPEDTDTPLEYKGIVYNEMKGGMSSPSARLMEKLNAMLYPDITYGFNSGGNPKDILSLTHQELCDFHQVHYHPSRCLFYFYGNIPTEKHLDFIGENLLDKVSPVPPLPSIPLQPRFTKPRKAICDYPAEEKDTPEANTTIAVAWLTCHVLNQDDLLALCVVDSILMDTDASPLKRALLDSKLCKQTGMTIDPDNAEVPIVTTFKGCNVKDLDALEKLLMDQLHIIAKQGIEPILIESALHQLEFHRSEISGDHFPFGLTLFTRAALLKQHGAPPENGLMIHTLFERLRKRLLEQPRYLESIIEKYFLNNPHRVTLAMVPNKELSAKEAEEERQALDAIKNSLTDQAKKELVKEAAMLSKFQKEQENQDEDVLPIVSISDIPQLAHDIRLDVYANKSLEIFHHACFTNQIAYIDYALPLCALTEEELPYVRLLVTLYGQMGCGNRTFAEVLTFLHAYTGGAGASTPIYYHSQYRNTNAYQFCLRGKALSRNLPQLCDILCEMAKGISFNDKPRLREIILKQWSVLQSTLTQSSMRYATNLAGSNMDTASHIGYLWYGLGYYYFIKQLAESLDSQLDAVVERLQNIQDRLLHGNNAHITLSCSNEIFEELIRNNYYGLADLPLKPFTPFQPSFTLPPMISQARIVASPVAFISRVLPTVSYSHPDAPALRLSSFLMDNLHLHHAIREQGGAYGGGASCSLMSGHFSFYAYRDPNIVSSLKAFDIAPQMVANLEFDEDDLFEAKLEMIQGMDSPIAPGSRADVAYTWWRESKPLAMRQQFRDKMLSLSREDIGQAVIAHIIPHLIDSTTVIFAGRDLIDAENAQLKLNGAEPFPAHLV